MSGALPRPSGRGAAAPFWAALRDGSFVLQRCGACGSFRHPPRPVCARCGSDAQQWAAAAGTGEVWSFTVVHPPTLPAFAERVPYGSVVVRLDEGVFLVSQLVDCPVEELAVGQRVELAPVPVDGELTLPRFRRAPGP